jgi:hypothetical protein
LSVVFNTLVLSVVFGKSTLVLSVLSGKITLVLSVVFGKITLVLSVVFGKSTLVLSVVLGGEFHFVLKFAAMIRWFCVIFIVFCFRKTTLVSSVDIF